MSWELWIAFVVASSALLAIPGPTVLIVVSYALGKGRQSAWATVPGLTLAPAIDHIGADNIMFETDIPHPTCLYPKSVERVRDAIGDLEPDVQKKILQDNAARLYKIDV